MTHDKVRQDFEAAKWFKQECPLTDELADKGDIRAIEQRNFALKAYQAGRAAERAEIREKLESDGVVEAVKQSVVLGEDEIGCDVYLNDIEAKQVIAAITKVLEVI